MGIDEKTVVKVFERANDLLKKAGTGAHETSIEMEKVTNIGEEALKVLGRIASGDRFSEPSAWREIASKARGMQRASVSCADKMRKEAAVFGRLSKAGHQVADMLERLV